MRLYPFPLWREAVTQWKGLCFACNRSQALSPASPVKREQGVGDVKNLSLKPWRAVAGLE